MEMIELYLLNGGGYGMLCRILQLFVGKIRMLFYKLNESMRHLLYFLLLVCFLGNIKAQKSVGQVNGFYVCSKTEDYN